MIIYTFRKALRHRFTKVAETEHMDVSSIHFPNLQITFVVQDYSKDKKTVHIIHPNFSYTSMTKTEDEVADLYDVLCVEETEFSELLEALYNKPEHDHPTYEQILEMTERGIKANVINKIEQACYDTTGVESGEEDELSDADINELLGVEDWHEYVADKDD